MMMVYIILNLYAIGSLWFAVSGSGFQIIKFIFSVSA